jgi:hypothetical protein
MFAPAGAKRNSRSMDPGAKPGRHRVCGYALHDQSGKTCITQAAPSFDIARHGFAAKAIQFEPRAEQLPGKGADNSSSDLPGGSSQKPSHKVSSRPSEAQSRDP